MADADEVDPADEPDTSATPSEPDEAAPTPTRASPTTPSETATTPTSVSWSPRVERPGPRPRPATRASRLRRGRSKKDKATPKQKRDSVEHKRTGPVTFVQQSVAELRKVVYPTGQQLVNYFVVVLIFVLFIIAYVSLLDLGIGAAIFRIFA